MIGVTLLAFAVGILVAILGKMFGFQTAEIISAEAVCVAFFGAILNFLYTQRTFRAANYPIPLIRIATHGHVNSYVIYVSNPHPSVLISNVKLSIKIKPGKTYSIWWRFMKSVDFCEFSVDTVAPGRLQEVGVTSDIIEMMNEHFPDVLQRTTINEREYFKVERDYSFKFIVKMSYLPYIPGGKKQRKTFKGTLKPVTSAELILERWEVDILQYLQPPISMTDIG